GRPLRLAHERRRRGRLDLRGLAVAGQALLGRGRRGRGVLVERRPRARHSPGRLQSAIGSATIAAALDLPLAPTCSRVVMTDAWPAVCTAAGILLLLVAIIRYKLQPFVALLVVSLVVGLAAGMKPGPTSQRDGVLDAMQR